MKLSVFSDSHVGRSVPQAIGDLRREAYRQAFSRAIDRSIEERVDRVAIEGDLFEKRSMKPEDAVFVENEFFRLVKNLPAVKIFVIRGNHDGSPENSALNYVRHPLAKYLVLLGDGNDFYIDEDICFAGMGYERYARAAFSRLKPRFAEGFKKARTKILMLHSFIEGFHEIPPGTPEHNTIPIREILDLSPNIVLTGHEHIRKEALVENGKSKTLFLTPGSTEAENIGEPGEYGMYIVDGRKPVYFPIRSLHSIHRIEIRGGNNTLAWYSEKILSEMKHLRLDEERGNIVHVSVRGESNENVHRLDLLISKDLEKMKKENPDILYVQILNQLKEVHGQVSFSPTGGPMDFIESILKPHLTSKTEEAMKAVEEISATMDEKASQKTQLLTDADREAFKEKWSDLLASD